MNTRVRVKKGVRDQSYSNIFDKNSFENSEIIRPSFHRYLLNHRISVM